MKNIYLVRHCSAAGQHKDSPLTTEGIRQAQLLSFFLSDHNFSIDKIISSPYLRAIESIKPYAENKNIKIDIDERLRERMLSNEPVDDWLEILDHSFVDHDFKLPGGESANNVIHRVNQVITELEDNNDVSNVMFVTHGNLLAHLLNEYDTNFGFNEWKQLKNPDVYLITYDNDVCSIKSLWDR